MTGHMEHSYQPVTIVEFTITETRMSQYNFKNVISQLNMHEEADKSSAQKTKCLHTVGAT
jgi:hypothetical protein